MLHMKGKTNIMYLKVVFVTLVGVNNCLCLWAVEFCFPAPTDLTVHPCMKNSGNAAELVIMFLLFSYQEGEAVHTILLIECSTVHALVLSTHAM